MKADGQHVLLIIGGGIAAYRSLDLARLLLQAGFVITPIMTESAKAFITPLSLETLCGAPVHDSLFPAISQGHIEHISLARSADLVIICPATANLMARMCHGLADDLATTLLLAVTAPIFIAPAMNVKMWEHPATQENLAALEKRGIQVIGPDVGEMACGEHGAGRLAQPETILAFVQEAMARKIITENVKKQLVGRRFLVTAGPTREAIDPVRYLSNHSSGLQGFAIAEMLASAGAEVILVCGPVSLPTPVGVKRLDVQTALEMEQVCLEYLPGLDGAICVAAVSDWRPVVPAEGKIKKSGEAAPPVLHLVENPDILAHISRHEFRPALVVGFAAETDDILDHARAKRLRKGCNWLLANHVNRIGRYGNNPGETVFGASDNQVYFLDGQAEALWPKMHKKQLALRLVEEIISFFKVTDS